jgi:hypothetical protein
MNTDVYNQIQLILINSSETEKELLKLFKKWGKDRLYSQVLHLDFGKHNQLIKSLIEQVSAIESAKIKKMKFPQEMKEYVKSLNTRRLLSLYNKSRSKPDLMFFCMKNELSQREHIPNKIESKEIRRKNSKKRTSKNEIERNKLKDKIILLKNKGYSSEAICHRLKIDETQFTQLLTETKLNIEFVDELKPIVQEQKIIVGYSDDGKPIFETYQVDIDEIVSVTKK